MTTTVPAHASAPTTNSAVIDWVECVAALTTPEQVVWCDGSDDEWRRLTTLLVNKGTFVRLPRKQNSFWCASDPEDVARVEDRTFICSRQQSDAGPTNNWMDPVDMKTVMTEEYRGAMAGRTMYVIAFCMGPLDAAEPKYGVQVTDSEYVAVSHADHDPLRSSRCGTSSMTGRRIRSMPALGRRAAASGAARRAVAVRPHQVHLPLPRGAHDLELRLRLRRQRPAGQEMLCAADRLEDGPRRGLAGRAHADPQTHLARAAGALHRRGVPVVLRQNQPRHAVTRRCRVDRRDHRRRHRLDALRRRRPPVRRQPRGRILRRRPRHRLRTPTRNAMATIERGNSIFTNVALTDDGDIWWEGMTRSPPAHLTDWKRRDWTPTAGEPAATPTPATAPRSRNARPSPPNGTIPPGCRSRRSSSAAAARPPSPWSPRPSTGNTGCSLRSTLSSETTAAATGAVGVVRRDPMAMLPFIGYHVGDYLQHWLDIGTKTDPDQLPKIFYVNWFRRGDDGEFLWPGFGENSRVLKWALQRIEGSVDARQDADRRCPDFDDIDLDGLDSAAYDDTKILAALKVDPTEWASEIESIDEWYATIGGNKLPDALRQQLGNLKQRLAAARR